MPEKENFDFAELILKFNQMYNLQNSKKPKLLPVERLKNFKDILLQEISEIDSIIEKYKNYSAENTSLTKKQELEILTEMSDWLGDIMVYTRSEALRFGLPSEDVLEIIMQSNFSKLSADGKPIYDERGKVMKGPNYWKPEPKITEFLRESIANK